MFKKLLLSSLVSILALSASEASNRNPDINNNNNETRVKRAPAPKFYNSFAAQLNLNDTDSTKIFKVGEHISKHIEENKYQVANDNNKLFLSCESTGATPHATLAVYQDEQKGMLAENRVASAKKLLDRILPRISDHLTPEGIQLKLQDLVLIAVYLDDQGTKSSKYFRHKRGMLVNDIDGTLFSNETRNIARLFIVMECCPLLDYQNSVKAKGGHFLKGLSGVLNDNELCPGMTSKKYEHPLMHVTLMKLSATTDAELFKTTGRKDLISLMQANATNRQIVKQVFSDAYDFCYKQGLIGQIATCDRMVTNPAKGGEGYVRPFDLQSKLEARARSNWAEHPRSFVDLQLAGLAKTLVNIDWSDVVGPLQKWINYYDGMKRQVAQFTTDNEAKTWFIKNNSQITEMVTYFDFVASKKAQLQQMEALFVKMESTFAYKQGGTETRMVQNARTILNQTKQDMQRLETALPPLKKWINECQSELNLFEVKKEQTFLSKLLSQGSSGMMIHGLPVNRQKLEENRHRLEELESEYAYWMSELESPETLEAGKEIAREALNNMKSELEMLKKLQGNR